jgi:excisionase family DNA binding protein
MEYLTTREVAETIRMSENYVARMCHAGQIKAKKLGNQWRISDAALDEFMDASGKTEPTRPDRLTKKQRQAVEQLKRSGGWGSIYT